MPRWLGRNGSSRLACWAHLLMLLLSLLLQHHSTLLVQAASAPQPFNPEVFASDDPEDLLKYVNDPVEATDASLALMHRALELDCAAPTDLLHEAPAPHKDAPGGANAVVGLALYPFFFSGFQRFVGSLRAVGYAGHIILGVSTAISTAELAYLKSMDVTMYAVRLGACDESIYGAPSGTSARDGRKAKGSAGSAVGGQLMRGQCPRGLETLKVCP